MSDNMDTWESNGMYPYICNTIYGYKTNSKTIIVKITAQNILALFPVAISKGFLISESAIFILIFTIEHDYTTNCFEKHYIFSFPKYSFIKFIANSICGLIHLFL